MSIIDKLLGRKAPQTPPLFTPEQLGFLTETFAGLESKRAGLGAHCLEFITTGAPAGVLAELSQQQSLEPGKLLGQPGRLRWGFSLQDKVQEKLAHASIKARRGFYAAVTAETPRAALVRLGKVLAAADAGTSLEAIGADTPDWLQYLVNDVFFATNPSGFKRFAQGHALPAWHVELLAELLSCEELDPDLALLEVFERKDLDSWYHDHLSELVGAPAVTRYLCAHPDATRALPGLLSAVGRSLLVTRIGRDETLRTTFADLIIALAVDSSKGVRGDAAPFVDGIPPEARRDGLEQLLRNGETSQRGQAAELLARLAGEDARAVLDGALAQESSKPVQQAIRAALSRLDAASDAGTQSLPEAPPWTPFPDTPLGEDAFVQLQANRAEIIECARLEAEEEAAENQAGTHKYTWRQKNYNELKGITDDDLRCVLNTLNGTATDKERTRVRRNGIQAVIELHNKLQALPGFGPTHQIRGLVASRNYYNFWFDDGFQRWLSTQEGGVDLRALADVLERAGLSCEDVARAALNSRWESGNKPADILPADCVWPFFAEHPEYIDQGLGLAPQAGREMRFQFEIGPTLHTLGTFPTLPARWLPRVMEFALGETRTYRAAAQRVLATLPDIGRRVIESLADTKSEIRIEAANWLAELRYTDAAEALKQRLAKESRETVRAAFLTTLEALGQDISTWLQPAALLAEARKGLKARPPAGLAWFARETLPACCWADGSAVDAEIIQWWLVLACKLKEPGGNALLTRYLGLLAPASRQHLGSMVLRNFIAQDTRHPSLDEGIAYAQATAQQRWQQFQQWYQNARPEHRQYYEAYNRSQEQVFEDCKREKMGEYLGSAIGEKGILALTAGAPGHELVSLLQQYMREHYQRRAQIEAMLEAAAAADDPLVIQLLLGISRRYRTASVQEKARMLVQRIADRNGWSQEQLADRTIPTAGYDDNGKFELQYGSRVFTLSLDAALKPELRNPDGKVVKALPEARQNDDPAQIKEAKAQFSASKKELKQVLELQAVRLREAMCTGRVWPRQEWQDYLHQHPIVGRLIQRLVWLELAPDGRLRASFRPTEDGSLINTGDDEVTLQDDSGIRLAHASLLEGGLAKAWLAHFKDYKLKPLFAQMDRELPELALQDGQGRDLLEISDRQGWVSDTFTLRGAFTRLGYQRAAAEDGGFFYLYFKDYTSVGIRVCIEFSGNTLPEENVPAALKALSFENMRTRGYNNRGMALRAVPPVLLAESYADYLALAAVCAGYDAAWEKKMPW